MTNLSNKSCASQLAWTHTHTHTHTHTLDLNVTFQPPWVKTVAAKEWGTFVDQPTNRPTEQQSDWQSCWSQLINLSVSSLCHELAAGLCVILTKDTNSREANSRVDEACELVEFTQTHSKLLHCCLEVGNNRKTMFLFLLFLHLFFYSLSFLHHRCSLSAVLPGGGATFECCVCEDNSYRCFEFASRFVLLQLVEVELIFVNLLRCCVT